MDILERVNALSKGTMLETLGIVITVCTDGYLEGSMPVDQRTVQPAQVLHGGASVVLVESLGSIGSNMLIDSENYYCVGLEVNANHIRGVKSGREVTGKATCVHQGRKTHVWEIKLFNADEKLVCSSRLTMIVLKRDRKDSI
jgi:1,4-dihydroxy-2-naphthoyl-CoA hydrolase